MKWKVFKNKFDNGLFFAFAIAALGLLMIFIPWNTADGLELFGFTIRTNNYSELGEFIGGITAPFLSLSAFILLYMTYLSQKQELFESRKILVQQSKNLEKQQFETTFFNLLNLHHDIVNNIDLEKNIRLVNKIAYKDKGKTTEKGRDCFRTFYEGFKHSLDGTDKGEYLKMIKTAYSIFYKKHQSDLGHYFRNLYHIIKLIKRSEIKNQQEYASLVRAQLSSHELLMLFYNGLSDYGIKFKPLIEEFHLLKNMPLDELLLKEHENLYNKSAFKKIVPSKEELKI